MHRGYIKLWRKIFDSGIQQEPMTFTMWIWILCNVTHKPLNYIARGQCIKLNPGELIIGRKKLSKELRISERSVRTCLHHLETWGNVTIRTTNRFSIINVINWEIYQGQEIKNDQQNDQEVTSKRPASDQQVTTKQEVKNVKKERKKKESGGNGIPDWIPKETWEAFKEFRIRKKAPLTNLAIKKTITELERLKNLGYDPKSVLEQSVYRGWAGVFPIRENQKSKDQTVSYTPPDRIKKILQAEIEREKYLRGEK